MSGTPEQRRRARHVEDAYHRGYAEGRRDAQAQVAALREALERMMYDGTRPAPDYHIWFARHHAGHLLGRYAGDACENCHPADRAALSAPVQRSEVAG